MIKNKLLQTILIIVVFLTSSNILAQTDYEEINEVINDTDFRLIKKYLNNPRAKPGFGIINDLEVLLQPTFQNYWIEHFIRDNKDALPILLKRDLAILKEMDRYVNETLKSTLKICDKKKYLEEVRASEFLLSSFENGHKNALNELESIIASYDDRMNVYNDLMDVEVSNLELAGKGAILQVKARIGISKVFEFVPEIGLGMSIYNFISNHYKIITTAFDYIDYRRSIPYVASSMNILKLYYLYNKGVIPFFNESINKNKALLKELKKYESYFLENGGCAEIAIVKHKSRYTPNFGSDSYGFKWELTDSDGNPLRPGISVRLNRNVSYEIIQVGNSATSFDRVITLTTNFEGKISTIWDKSDPRQEKTTFKILTIKNKEYFYNGNGDILSALTINNLGHLKMIAYNEDNQETKYNVGIYKDRNHIVSMNGKGRMYDILPGDYTLKFHFKFNEIIENNVVVEAGKTTVVKVNIPPKSKPDIYIESIKLKYEIGDDVVFSYGVKLPSNLNGRQWAIVLTSKGSSIQKWDQLIPGQNLDPSGTVNLGNLLNGEFVLRIVLESMVDHVAFDKVLASAEFEIN